MCGRFSLTTPLEALRALFGFPEQSNLAPRANIAPTQEVSAVVAQAGERHLTALRWGLIPSWAKERAIGAKMINARSETVGDKPAFRQAFARRRCLIPADGFYEWQAAAQGPKQPYRIEFKQRPPFAFAGLWESWRDPASGETVKSCTILTTSATNALAWLHERMPVVLEPAAFDLWLADGFQPLPLLALLKPYPATGGFYGAMTTFPVSTALNKVANEGVHLANPLESQKSLF